MNHETRPFFSGRWRWSVCAALAIALGAVACQEQLAAPAECPQACPGGRPVVRDTVLDAIVGGDTSFVGFIIPGTGVGGLLVSDSLPGADDRAFLRFIGRSDSVLVDTTERVYTIDSVAIALTVMARDSAVHGLFIYLYRLPVTVDSGESFASIESQLVPANLFDSIAVADTLLTQALRLVYQGPTLSKIAIPPADSGQLAFGFRIRAAGHTGARIGGIGSGTAVPTFSTYVTVTGDTDSTTKTQTIVRSPAFSRYVSRSSTSFDPDLLTVGAPNGIRTLVRFPWPAYLKDSVLLVRATLELTPVDTFHGLPLDSSFINSTGILADFGEKSPRGTAVSSTLLPLGSIDTIHAEVVQEVRQWQVISPAVPPALLLSLVPEGASFTQPIFRSTRSADGRPRLRVTYQVPFQFERP